MERPSNPPSEAPPTAAELVQSGYRYALSLTHRGHDAEDLVQESWLRLCRRHGNVETRAVLYATIRNLFIDHCRRAKVVAFDPLEADGREHAIAESLTPGTLDDLEVLLGMLRPGEREVIYLHHVEGCTAAEIGHLTGQPRGTVLSLLHRAYHKLRGSAAASGS